MSRTVDTSVARTFAEFRIANAIGTIFVGRSGLEEHFTSHSQIKRETEAYLDTAELLSRVVPSTLNTE